MKTLLGVFLALIGVFCGGCSLYFAYGDLAGYLSGTAMIWAPSLALAAVAAWGAWRLLRKPPPPNPPSE